MQKVTIRTQWNRESSAPESFKDSYSLTVPDQSYTPKQLLDRFAKGLPTGKLLDLSYHKDIFFDDPRRMDLVDIDNALDVAKRRHEHWSEELDKKVKAHEEARESLLQKRMRPTADQHRQNSESKAKAQKEEKGGHQAESD